MIEQFSAMPLMVSIYLCQTSFLRWRRTHKKARIRKKWRKRYGAVFSQCKGHFYKIGDTFMACPCVAAQIRKVHA